MEIGFPVVGKDKAGTWAVWLDIRRSAENAPGLFFNMAALDPARGRIRDLGLGTAFDAIMSQGYDVRMDSRWGAGEKVEELPIRGGSWGGCLKFLQRYSVEDVPLFAEILLSAQLDSSEQAVRPLGCNVREDGGKTETQLKAEYARDKGYILILDERDAKDLHGVGVYREANYRKARQDARTQTANDMKGLGDVWLRFPHWCKSMLAENDGCGFVFVLPGENDDEVDYRMDRLAELLGAKKRQQAQPAQNLSGLSFRDFYRTMFPSFDQGALDAFFNVPVNSAIADKRLFKDGVLEKALDEECREAVWGSLGNDPFRHILLGGPTGCGKTVLATAIMLNDVVENAGRVVYVAPTRMLTQEVYAKVYDMLPAPGDANGSFPIDRDRDIFVSTGENYDNDWRIAAGDFRMAFIVCEKANLFFQQEKGLSELVTLLVADEVHMLVDPIRGNVLDTLLAKVRTITEERREFGRNKNLRVLAVTTESVAEQKNLRRFLSLPEDLEGNPAVEPQIIVSDERPVAVEHYIQIFDKKHYCKAVHIATHKQDDSLILSDMRINSIRKEIAGCVDDSRTPKTRNELIWDHIRKHEKVIVSFRSTDDLLKTVSWLSASAPPLENGNMRQILDELASRLKTCSLSSSESKVIRHGAEKGIFVHYADLDYDLRRWMEKAFKNLHGTRTFPLVLCATETLTYGVNLPSECLVMLDIRWPREHPVSGALNDAPLSYNQYHNLLGRVGRLGEIATSVQCKVVVFAPRNDQARIDDILNQYKKPEELKPLTIKHDLKACKNETMVDLNEVSYSTFRTLLDALRFVGRNNNVPFEKIWEYLQQTYLCHVYAGAPRLKQVFLKTLELAQKVEPEIIKVEQDKSSSDGTVTRRYRLLEEGEALIDTGTKPQSISPMLGWIRVVGKWKNLNPPVELLVPALVAVPDLWKMMRSFCEESRFVDKSAGSTEGYSIACGLLDEELGRLSPAISRELRDEFVKALPVFFRDYCSNLSLSDDYKHKAANEFREVAFVRLVTALLRWLRGAGVDEVNQLTVQKYTGQELSSGIKDKHVYKANWLAIMCMRFFSKVADTPLLNAHERELPRLAMRLKLGIPSHGLPFMRKEGLSNLISRSEVLHLLDKRYDPMRILSLKDPAANTELRTIVAEFAPNGDKNDCDWMDNEAPALIRNRVKSIINYYLVGGQRLFSVLGERDDEGDYGREWDFLSRYLDGLRDNFIPSRKPAKGIG